MSNETMDITEARKHFNRMDERLADAQVIQVTRHGTPAFAVVDTAYLAAVLETIEIMTDPGSYRLFMESLADIKHGRVVDHDDAKKEFL